MKSPVVSAPSTRPTSFSEKLKEVLANRCPGALDACSRRPAFCTDPGHLPILDADPGWIPILDTHRIDTDPDTDPGHVWTDPKYTPLAGRRFSGLAIQQRGWNALSGPHPFPESRPPQLRQTTSAACPRLLRRYRSASWAAPRIPRRKAHRCLPGSRGEARRCSQIHRRSGHRSTRHQRH